MAVIIDGTNGITNVNGSAATPAETGTDTDTGIYYGTNTVSLSTGGTQRLTVDSSGRLLVGTGTASSSANVTQVLYKTGDNYLQIASGTTGGGLFGQVGANMLFYTYTGAVGSESFSERMRIASDGNVVVGTAALATSATAGFPWIPSCAGTPTGAPTAPYTNAGALVVDTTNSNLNVRVGSVWRAINTVPSADFKASLTDSTARTYTGGTYYSLGSTGNTITDNSLVAFRLYVQVSDAAWHTAIGGTVAGLCVWKADGTLAEWSFILDGHVTAYSGITATIRRDAGYGNGPFSIKFSSNITVASGGFVRLDILRLL